MLQSLLWAMTGGWWTPIHCFLGLKFDPQDDLHRMAALAGCLETYDFYAYYSRQSL